MKRTPGSTKGAAGEAGAEIFQSAVALAPTMAELPPATFSHAQTLRFPKAYMQALCKDGTMSVAEWITSPRRAGQGLSGMPASWKWPMNGTGRSFERWSRTRAR